MSSAWSEVLGTTPDALRAAPFRARVHPEDLGPSREVLAPLAGGEPAVRFVHRCRTDSRGWIPLEWTASAPGPDGRVPCIVRDLGAGTRDRVGPRGTLTEALLGVGHWRLERAEGLLIASRTARRLLGLDDDPAVPLGRLEPRWQAEGNGDLVGLFRDALQAPSPFDRRLEVHRGGFDPRIVRIAGRPEWDGQRRAEALAGIAVDLTPTAWREQTLGERAAAAEQVAARHRVLQRLAETQTPSFRELYAAYGTAGRAYTGLPSGGVFLRAGSGVEGASPEAVLPSERAQAEMRAAVTEGAVVSWRSERADASGRHEVLLAAPIRAQTTLRGVLAFHGMLPPEQRAAADLEFVALASTALGRAIETLEASRNSAYQRRLFEGLFRRTPDGIMLEDSRHHHVLMVNDALCRMLRLPRAQIVGRPASQFFSEDLPVGGPSTDSGPTEATLGGAHGEAIPVELVRTTIEDHRGQPVAVMHHLRDITARQKIEAMKLDFIAVASHELRTPLTATLGALSLLRSQPSELSDDAAELVDLAHRSGDRLKILVDDILDLQRLAGGRLPMNVRPVEIAELARTAMAEHREIARGLGVELALTSAIDATVLADADRILQVLTNLLSNATKHAPAGSRVDLRVAADARAVHCAVRDWGPGIPEDFRPRAFDEFTQVDPTATRRTSGSGLGLAISKAIVEAHGGTIGFECPDDGGTEFTFSLPRRGVRKPAS